MCIKNKKMYIIGMKLFFYIFILFFMLACEKQGTKINVKKIEPFKTKEECYKAAHEFKNNCLNNGGKSFDCISETYCDSRGCC